eukprot:1160570-Pelagomonas_calceolata.AAC.5
MQFSEQSSNHAASSEGVYPEEVSRCLGMMFDKNFNLHYAAKEALKPCLADMARIRAFAHQHQSLSNSTGPEPVHVFKILSSIATALFYKKVFHADISLSSRNPSCWTSHLLFAMNGLHHAHVGTVEQTEKPNYLAEGQIPL